MSAPKDLNEALADFRRAVRATPEWRALERFVEWLARKLDKTAAASAPLKGHPMRTLDYETRTRLEAEARERILALPKWTLMRLGWEVRPGRVQGQVFYRVGDGLGPIGRDDTPALVLSREVQRVHMPHHTQHWGIDVLALPASPLKDTGGSE